MTETGVPVALTVISAVSISLDIKFEQVCMRQNNTSHQITLGIVSTDGAGSVVNVCTGIIKH